LDSGLSSFSCAEADTFSIESAIGDAAVVAVVWSADISVFSSGTVESAMGDAAVVAVVWRVDISVFSSGIVEVITVRSGLFRLSPSLMREGKSSQQKSHQKSQRRSEERTLVVFFHLAKIDQKWK
jgi:hypothetical protein